MQQVIIRLLGSPELRYKEQLIRIPRRRSRALLFYMVCTHTPQPRERLLDVLCGEMDEESARHTFKTLLAEVRAQLRSLEPSVEWIIGDGDQLTLNPLAPLWLDTEIFETSAATRNLTQAIELYRGPFLDGFFLKDSPGFESWTRSTRDHFHHIYLNSLRRLAEMYESAEQFEQAITCTQMLVEADPLSEDAHARLMRFYWMNGERVEALRQYEKLQSVLAQELAVQPMASTRALYEQIARDISHSVASSSGNLTARVQLPVVPPATPFFMAPSADIEQETATAPFVGREKELAFLRTHLMNRIHPPLVLLIQGEANCGKSRLLHELLRQCCASWPMLHATCHESERSLPYHEIAEALRQRLSSPDLSQLNLSHAWVHELARLLPDLFPLDPGLREPWIGTPTVFADALVALLQQLASSQHPLVLALDDLHHANAQTLTVLGYVARRLHYSHSGRLFILGTYRSDMARKRLTIFRHDLQRLDILAECQLERLASPDSGEANTSDKSVADIIPLPVSPHSQRNYRS